MKAIEAKIVVLGAQGKWHFYQHYSSRNDVWTVLTLIDEMVQYPNNVFTFIC